MIRTVTLEDRAVLLDIAAATGLFSEVEAEQLLGEVLTGLSAGVLPRDHSALVCADEASTVVLGWVYFVPDVYAEAVWNLWWIGVLPKSQRRGVGKELLKYVESQVSKQSGRILIIETSDAESTSKARGFYERMGYRECGRIPDFYAEGEAKVIYVKRLCPF